MASREARDVADLRFAAGERPTAASRRFVLIGRVAGLSLISSVAALDLVPVVALGAMAGLACVLGAYEVHRSIHPWTRATRRPAPQGQVARL